MDPVGIGDEVQILLGDIGHEKQLFRQERTFHLIGFDLEEPTETAYGFSVQPFSLVRLMKGVGVEVVPGIHKREDRLAELRDREKIAVSQTFGL